MADDKYNACAPDCGCNETGDVTNEELAQQCAYLWMVVCRKCEELPVRVTPFRFAEFAVTLIDEEMIARIFENIINTLLGGYVTQEEFLVVKNKVTDLCDRVAANEDCLTSVKLSIQEILAAIEAINNAIDGGFGITKAEVELCIASALANYYTRAEVLAITDNIQAQVTNNANKIVDLQAQIDACCNTPAIVPPTIDAVLTNLTDPICPQCLTRTVTNPDNLLLQLVVTGTGTVTVSVDGTLVTNFTSFVVPDGGELEICLTGADGVNVVGGVALNWLDANDIPAVIDGFSYDVTCPDAPVAAPVITCPANTVVTIGGTVNLSTGNTGGAVDTWSISPALPPTLTFANGNVTGTATAITANTTYTVTATNATGSDTCTFDLEVEAAAPIGATGSGGCATDPNDNNEPPLWCGAGTAPGQPSGGGGNNPDFQVGGAITGTTCGVGFNTFINTIDGPARTIIKLTAPLPVNVTQFTVNGIVVDVSAFTGQTDIQINDVGSPNAPLHSVLQGNFTIVGNC